MWVSLVAAVAENGVIGSDGEMPWHYPTDLKRFKEITTGHPVVMGRKTYESIESRLGGPLPDRTNIVLSRQESLDLPAGAVHARDTEEALELAADTLEEQETVYVIGGATVYEQFIGDADELRITEIPESPEGDTEFPTIGNEWEELEREAVGEMTFVRYER